MVLFMIRSSQKVVENSSLQGGSVHWTPDGKMSPTHPRSQPELRDAARDLLQCRIIQRTNANEAPGLRPALKI
jgi:hypothetical protein